MGGTNESSDFEFKLLLVGDLAVGKSCLVKRYAVDTFDKHNNSTIGVDFMIKFVRVGDVRIKLKMWDTAGNERFRSLTRAYYRDTHGIMFVYDITRKKSLEQLDSFWIREVLLNNTIESAAKILVGNKADLKDKREVSCEEGRKFAEKHGCRFAEVSAKENTGVATAFDLLCKDIQARPELMRDAERQAQAAAPHRKPAHPARHCCLS